MVPVPPGASAVELPDVYDVTGEGRVRIRLDPRRTAADNGQRLLRLAGRYRRRLQVLPERLERLQQEERDLDQLLRRLGRGETVEDNEVEQRMGDRAPGARAGNARPEAGIHPRRYRTSQGWSVWAGRSNRENDQLTHVVAAPDDIWFHARGYPGTHVVLRREGRAEGPSGRTLEEAAGIAAFWSKGKTAKKVPVSYTAVKHVTRPRGGAAGEALLRREKTLVVAPALPPQEDQA